MRKFLLAIFLSLVFAANAYAAPSYFVVSGVARTGGGTGALDKIECEDVWCNDSNAAITTGSIAFIVDSSKILYVYRYNAVGEDSEIDPEIIVPDDRADCSSKGQWELITSFRLGASTSAKIGFLDSDCPGTDKDVGNIEIGYVDGGDGAENADVSIKITQGGAEDTLVLHFDESDDQWEFKKVTAFEEGIKITSTKHIIVGANQWDNGSDKIDGAMIEDNGIDSDQYAAASIDNEHLADDAVGTAEINTDAVTMDAVDADGVFTSLTGPWATTGLLSGGVVTKVASEAYTIGTTNAAEAYGGVIYVTGAAVITYPAVVAGMHFTIITVGDVAVSGKPNANDLQYLDGAVCDDADKVTNTSGAGDLIVVTYYDGTGWWTISGSNDGDPWTDTGA